LPGSLHTQRPEVGDGHVAIQFPHGPHDELHLVDFAGGFAVWVAVVALSVPDVCQQQFGDGEGFSIAHLVR